MKRFCFLFNPSTNRRRSRRKFEEIKRLTQNWQGVSFKISENRSDLRKLATAAARNFEVVVACGGDGTVKEVATVLWKTDAKLGLVPLGSGNDFSKALGLPKRLPEVLEVLHNGNTRDVDLGKCNDFYFINTLGFGFDGKTNRYAGQSTIQNGTLRYTHAALKTMRTMESFQAEISLEDLTIPFQRWMMLTVANGRVEGGNFVVAPQASVFDGKLTFLTVRPVPKWLLPLILPFFLIGKAHWLPMTSYHEANEIRLRFDRPVSIHADGEQVDTSQTEFSIELLPGALKAIC